VAAALELVDPPGCRNSILVRTCREAGIRVVPLPGPCAAITALSAAGLPSDRFCYEGFLPAKSKGRRDALKAIEAEPRTLIFYESTHRLLDSLEDIVAVLGESRYVVLARELTKTWETIHGAPVGELLAWVKEDENRRKGEMVLIVEGHKAQEEDLPADALRTLALLQAELPLKKAAALDQAYRYRRPRGGARYQLLFPLVRVNFELGVIMVIAVSCVKLLSAHNSTQHTSRKHKV
jgi:conserved hypothetical protein TIGR00096